jgi:hypothetical protein
MGLISSLKRCDELNTPSWPLVSTRTVTPVTGAQKSAQVQSHWPFDRFRRSHSGIHRMVALFPIRWSCRGSFRIGYDSLSAVRLLLHFGNNYSNVLKLALVSSYDLLTDPLAREKRREASRQGNRHSHFWILRPVNRLRDRFRIAVLGTILRLACQSRSRCKRRQELYLVGVDLVLCCKTTLPELSCVTTLPQIDEILSRGRIADSAPLAETREKMRQGSAKIAYKFRQM